jgi:hypothetical protein
VIIVAVPHESLCHFQPLLVAAIASVSGEFLEIGREERIIVQHLREWRLWPEHLIQAERAADNQVDCQQCQQAANDEAVR